MQVIADLQLHSRFARAVSKDMTVSGISTWAEKKGIGLVATGDWTHPVWYRELLTNLKEVNDGVFRYKDFKKGFDKAKVEPHFLLSTEVSSIYSQGDKTRRIHTLIFAPSFKTVELINKEFSRRGVKLMSDGRPVMGLSAKEVAKIALEVDERCLIIPAHAWTPWFSLYGSKSGFDSIEECFGEYAKEIFAIETGLSSDPAMNWRIGELENRRLVSFSDAHSPQKLGREATVFNLSDLTYENISKAIKGDKKEKILWTIEFYPEEGKYHYSGHRKCGVILSPKEVRKKGRVCPVCGKDLTIGVLSRVGTLADKEVATESSTDKYGVRWIKDKKNEKPPYVMLVPLLEIVAETLDVGVKTKTTGELYEKLIASFGSEFDVLLKTPLEEIEKVGGKRIREGIGKVRGGDIYIKPGYDGVFGEVKIWKDEDQDKQAAIDQGTLF